MWNNGGGVGGWLNTNQRKTLDEEELADKFILEIVFKT